VAQVTRWTAPGARPAVRLQVAAEQGLVRVDLPGRLRWRQPDGQYAVRLPARPAAVVLLEQFHRAVTENQPPWPSFAVACQGLRLLRAALDSLASGGWQDVTG
jgi:hypothetical protein